MPDPPSFTIHYTLHWWQKIEKYKNTFKCVLCLLAFFHSSLQFPLTTKNKNKKITQVSAMPACPSSLLITHCTLMTDAISLSLSSLTLWVWTISLSLFPFKDRSYHPGHFLRRRRHCQQQALSVSFIHDSCQFWYNTVSFRKHTNNISYGFIVVTSNPSLFSSFSEDPSLHGLQAGHERRVVPGNRIVWWAED